MHDTNNYSNFATDERNNIMKRYIYNRVSSLAQDYEQQQHCINEYFARMGIDRTKIDAIVVEKISGTVNHTERKLADLIKRCESGDTIYISEMSRLGRNMSDLFAIVTECTNKGITIIQCKDGTIIENNSIAGKALLFALGLAAEIEVQNIRQRTTMGLNVRKDWLKENGSFVSKAGNVCTKLGRPADVNGKYDLSLANAASAQASKERAEQWRITSKGYAAVRRWWGQGWSRNQILAEFNAQHEIDPENYSTPTGAALSKGTLSKWLREIGSQLDVVLATAQEQVARAKAH